jgi:hypothetical protein
MPFTKRRCKDPPPIYSTEIDKEFINLAEVSADLLERINSSADLNEEEQMVLMADTLDAGVRWTRLSDGGYFLSASKPFSDALAEIMLGMNINDVAHVKKGLDQMRDTARRFT